MSQYGSFGSTEVTHATTNPELLVLAEYNMIALGIACVHHLDVAMHVYTTVDCHAA